jgi:hypothetical protein
MYEYCAGKHWGVDWVEENRTATYFLRSGLFTYDIMKNEMVNIHTFYLLMKGERCTRYDRKITGDCSNFCLSNFY